MAGNGWHWMLPAGLGRETFFVDKLWSHWHTIRFFLWHIVDFASHQYSAPLRIKFEILNRKQIVVSTVSTGHLHLLMQGQFAEPEFHPNEWALWTCETVLPVLVEEQIVTEQVIVAEQVVFSEFFSQGQILVQVPGHFCPAPFRAAQCAGRNVLFVMGSYCLQQLGTFMGASNFMYIGCRHWLDRQHNQMTWVLRSKIYQRAIPIGSFSSTLLLCILCRLWREKSKKWALCRLDTSILKWSI
jgi:hypothetical protein